MSALRRCQRRGPPWGKHGSFRLYRRPCRLTLVCTGGYLDFEDELLAKFLVTHQLMAQLSNQKRNVDGGHGVGANDREP